MTAHPSLPPPPLLPASGLSQQTAREHVPGPGSTSPGRGAQPWAVEHKPGRGAQVQAKEHCRQALEGAALQFCLFPSLPGVSDAPCEPLGPAVGSCYCRKDTPAQGRGSGTLTRHQKTLTLLREGLRTLRTWRSPISSDRPWGGEQPPSIAGWACTSRRPPRDPLCLGSVDPGPCSAVGQLVTWATWPCCPNTSGSFLGPSRQCHGKSSQRELCGRRGNHPRFPDGVRRLGCGLVSKAVDAFKASARARFQNPRWKLQSGFPS